MKSVRQIYKDIEKLEKKIKTHPETLKKKLISEIKYYERMKKTHHCKTCKKCVKEDYQGFGFCINHGTYEYSGSVYPQWSTSRPGRDCEYCDNNYDLKLKRLKIKLKRFK